MHWNFFAGGKNLWVWLKEHRTVPVYWILSVYVIHNFFAPLPEHPARALFLLFVFVGLFLKPRSEESNRYLTIFDFTLSILSVVVFGYILLNHREISERVGIPSNLDIIMGLACIAVVIEGVRRGFGLVLCILVCVFLAYFFLGQYIPVEYGGHVGYNIGEIANALYLSTVLDGIFGISTYVMFNYIFLFFLFGNLLLKTNSTKFVMDLAMAVVGKTRGGAAIVSVTGSGALGSISGLSTGNVMMTGVVTIPLMKKTGFQPYVAAGVEAAASSGGQIMPPVMGTVSFLMMAFLGLPYASIIKVAIIPALLFYAAIITSVYFYSLRVGAIGLDGSEIPRLSEVLRRREGITFFGSFAVLVTLIVMKYSPMLAVMSAIIVGFILSLFSPSRMNLKTIADLIYDTGKGFVGLGAVGAGMGIVIGTTLQSGLAFRVTGLLLDLTSGQIIPTLFAVFLASFILGMGLPPIIVYIVSVLVAAPALVELGVMPLAAHLFCFYAAICSELSPPIAAAAFVASTVAETNFWKTCIFSMMFGAAAHILPFAFALEPSLLLMGTFSSIIFAVGTALCGVVFLSWGIAGPFSNFINVISRILILLGGLLLIFPGQKNAVIGYILVLTGGGIELLHVKFKKPKMEAVALR